MLTIFAGTGSIYYILCQIWFLSFGGLSSKIYIVLIYKSGVHKKALAKTDEVNVLTIHFSQIQTT